MMKNLGYAAISAAAVATLFIACGGDTEGDLSCTSDTDCAGTEICHPDAQVCVETCTAATDCPDHAKTCAAISDTDSRQVCQCATDALCENGPVGVGAVCQDAWSVCTAACETTTDCPTGYECEASTGQCRAETGGGQCDPGCGPHQTCNNGTCETTSCSSSNAQPDACGYGAFCDGSSCAEVPAPTCSNITNLQVASGAWDPREWDAANPAHNGPVIYDMEKTTADATFCTAGSARPDNIRVRVSAYRTEGTFPNNKEGNAGFLYALVNGTTQEAHLLVRPSGYTVSNDGKHAEFLVNFCVPAADSQVQVGLYFTNGNAMCGTFQK